MALSKGVNIIKNIDFFSEMMWAPQAPPKHAWEAPKAPTLHAEFIFDLSISAAGGWLYLVRHGSSQSIII